ncbi:hypothetical protein J0S82_004361 [Galemys pyrenaicus]|uniref:Uncharacterized protein n=1 Tax=Galemys pyrenaicus TaxID=202257 RepID=A0A8J6B1U3_GALPY|nr:hypothetical protein J0S82_004361 [Galemys pyrenaicus]
MYHKVNNRKLMEAIQQAVPKGSYNKGFALSRHNTSRDQP